MHKNLSKMFSVGEFFVVKELQADVSLAETHAAKS
jgi:hypothetical protein